MRKVTKWIFTIFLFMSINQVNAQQTNIQETRADSLSWKIKFDIGGNRSTGFFSRLGFRGDLGIDFEYGRWELHNNLNYLYTDVNGFTLMDNWLNIVYLGYYLGSDWRLSALALHYFETNLIYRVESRHRTGVGIRAIPYKKDGGLIRFTTGVFYEDEQYNGDLFLNSELQDNQRTNPSTWFHGTATAPLISKMSSITLDFWYFQSFDEREDFALTISPMVQLKLGSHFTFFAKYDWRFENVYLESLTDTNDNLVFGFGANFGS